MDTQLDLFDEDKNKKTNALVRGPERIREIKFEIVELEERIQHDADEIAGLQHDIKYGANRQFNGAEDTATINSLRLGISRMREKIKTLDAEMTDIVRVHKDELMK